MKKILLLLIFPFLSSCQTMNPEKYTKKQLIFGSGGGFTNLVNEYRLLESGEFLHKTSLEKKFESLKKANEDSTKKFFIKADSIFNPLNEKGEPSNMYYFLKLKEGNNVKEIVWGSGEPPKKTKLLYDELMDLIEKQ